MRNEAIFQNLTAEMLSLEIAKHLRCAIIIIELKEGLYQYLNTEDEAIFILIPQDDRGSGLIIKSHIRCCLDVAIKLS
jgi:hypothetical protein